MSCYPGKISSSLTVICKQLSIYSNSNCYHKLSIYNDLALLDKHIVIACALQKVVPDNFHSTSQGVRGMRFPDLNISNHRKACTDCFRNAPLQQPESLILIPSPTYPFEEICVDYFHTEVNSYLCIVDPFSEWICIYSFRAHEKSNSKLYDISRGTCLQHAHNLIVVLRPLLNQRSLLFKTIYQQMEA